MTAYQFPTTRRRRSRLPSPGGLALPATERPPAAEVGLIKGRLPDSIQEWWVALALDRLKVEYDYQVPVAGAGTLEGYRVDFVVYIPFATPLEPFEEYWHGAQMSDYDRLRLAVIFQKFQVEPILLYSQDLATPEQTLETVRKVLRL